MTTTPTILAHVDAGSHVGVRLQAARTLATQLGGAVTALYAVRPVYVELAFEVASAGLASQALLAYDDERRRAARAAVDAAGGHIEWQEVPEGSEYTFIRQALYHDWLVLGQRDPAEREAGVLPDFVQTVLTATGKPALIVPYIAQQAPRFDSVFVAWKESRESARALAAALPLLRAARQVDIGLAGDMEPEHKALLKRWLEHHGVQPRWQTVSSDAAHVGEMLLSTAADLSADLMVMGCYGHTRAREFVLGGATRTVLQSMTLPVLMVH